jgi:formylglycine-generating enzyme required for sulfatase activity
MIAIALLVALAAVGCAVAQEPPKEEPPKQNPPAEAQSDPKLTERIVELIGQLGDDDFDKREAAQGELIKIGKPALEALEKTLKESEDAEVRNRCEAIAGEIRRHVMTLIGKNAQGYEEYRHEKTGMVFVKVPGGTFKMGSDTREADEKPVHEVKLDGFLIAKYEVTQAVWLKVMRSEAESRPGAGGKNRSNFKGDDLPVENVSWNDCEEFCEKTGLRLPTEAEWEYACRAGTDTKYYWGDEPGGDYMWYSQNSEEMTHPVGQKKPNGFGLYDVSGNVWEWCEDWYGADYYQNSPHDNPKGPDNGECRVLRGVSWYRIVNNCRSSNRSRNGPAYWNNLFGFRCAFAE